MKSIASSAKNLSAITFFGEILEHISMNTRIEVAKFEPKPAF